MHPRYQLSSESQERFIFIDIRVGYGDVCTYFHYIDILPLWKQQALLETNYIRKIH